MQRANEARIGKAARLPQGQRLVRSVDRALAILDAFDDAPAGRGLSELSRKLGMNKATLLRICRTLQSHGLIVQREDNHVFLLGAGLIRLGVLALRQSGLVEVSRPHVRHLQALTEETVCLFVVSGVDRLCVDVVQSQHDLRMTIDVGTTRALHAGAAGKVLLAFMAEEATRRILLERRLQRFTERTITDGHEILQKLDEIRKKRFAVSRDEIVPGGAAIAAPIFDRDETAVAAINVLGPQVRLTPARIERLVPLVREAAEAISRDLGHSRAGDNRVAARRKPGTARVGTQGGPRVSSSRRRAVERS